MSTTKNLLGLFGLKWNPFGSDVPTEAVLVTAAMESFCWRIEQSQLREGGFAIVTGEPGTGKSVTLRVLAERLEALGGEIAVGELAHPQSNVADFYREMGDVFGVQLRPHNRWHGFKSLRATWQNHIETTLVRPVLLIDESQEMSAQVLSELRILSSTRFDSRIILTVVLAGDARLKDMLRRSELLPLGSRVRTRLELGQATPQELKACLEHRMRAAGNARLMTRELVDALCDHSLGNYRMMTTLASDLLAAGAQREVEQLDEKLFFELMNIARPPKAVDEESPKKRRARRR